MYICDLKDAASSKWETPLPQVLSAFFFKACIRNGVWLERAAKVANESEIQMRQLHEQLYFM